MQLAEITGNRGTVNWSGGGSFVQGGGMLTTKRVVHRICVPGAVWYGKATVVQMTQFSLLVIVL